MKPLVLLFAAELICCVSCNNMVEQDGSIHVPIVSCKEVDNVSPTQVYGMEPKYIKLSSSDSIGVAVSGIRKLIIKNGRIYVLNKTESALSVFDMDGTHLLYMDFAGRGPKEYLQISDFDVDNEGVIWITDARKNALFKYSDNLSFLQSFPYDYEITGIHCLDNGDFLYKIAQWETGELAHTMLVISDASMVVKSELAMYPEYTDDNFVYQSNFSTGRSGVMFLEPIDYHLYSIDTNGSVDAMYFLDYGEFMVPERWRRNIEYHFDEIFNNYYVIVGSYRIADPFLTFEVSHSPCSSVIVNTDSMEITYFPLDESCFSLVGQCTEGSIWQLSEGTGFDTLPSYVQTWIIEGNDVLAIYPDSELKK